ARIENRSAAVSTSQSTAGLSQSTAANTPPSLRIRATSRSVGCGSIQWHDCEQTTISTEHSASPVACAYPWSHWTLQTVSVKELPCACPGGDRGRGRRDGDPGAGPKPAAEPARPTSAAALDAHRERSQC